MHNDPGDHNKSQQSSYSTGTKIVLGAVGVLAVAYGLFHQVTVEPFGAESILKRGSEKGNSHSTEMLNQVRADAMTHAGAIGGLPPVPPVANERRQVSWIAAKLYGYLIV